MLKRFIRNIAIYSFSLFLLPNLVSGVNIDGGLQTFLIGGLGLSLLVTFLKPVFNVLTFPFNIITLGLFSIITNALILYLLTVFVPNITITEYHFSGGSWGGFTIPAVSISTLFAFIISAIVLSAISGTIRWFVND